MRDDTMRGPTPRPDAAGKAVTAAFSLLPYPITKDMAIEAVGDCKVPCGARRVPLGRMLDMLPEREFESQRSAQSAVERDWDHLIDALGRYP